MSGLERYQFQYVAGQLISVLEHFDTSGSALLPPTEYFLSGVNPTGFASWVEFLESLYNECDVKTDEAVIDCYTDGTGNYKKGVRLMSYADPTNPVLLATLEEDRLSALDTAVWSVETDKTNCNTCGCN